MTTYRFSFSGPQLLMSGPEIKKNKFAHLAINGSVKFITGVDTVYAYQFHSVKVEHCDVNWFPVSNSKSAAWFVFVAKLRVVIIAYSWVVRQSVVNWARQAESLIDCLVTGHDLLPRHHGYQQQQPQQQWCRQRNLARPTSTHAANMIRRLETFTCNDRTNYTNDLRLWY